MNKGMIMEVKKSYAITLNDNGIMEKIKFKPNMAVGQKIFYFEDDVVTATASKVHRHNSFIKTFGSIAALFLLVFTFFNTMKPEQAYAVVSLDINPSIQIEADSKQRIIKVYGMNDDGKNIDFSDVKNISLDEGMQKIKEKLVEKNYLEANKEVLVVAFIKNGDSSGYEESLQAAIRSTFDTEDITYVKADKKEVEEAKTEGISLGRYKAKETATVDDATKDKMSKAPVKEITALIKDKENVIQWEAKDEQKPAQVPAAETKPAEVKPDKPAADSNASTSVGKDNKPAINVPSENGGSKTDKGDGKEVTPSKPKNNDIIELEPEKPVMPENGKMPPKAVDDSSIIIAPNNGTIENSTTSGKIPEETKGDKTASGSTTQVEPKTDVVNK
jgi:hypothetical protein